jgi:hypothetical protein
MGTSTAGAKRLSTLAMDANPATYLIAQDGYAHWAY